MDVGGHLKAAIRAKEKDERLYHTREALQLQEYEIQIR